MNLYNFHSNPELLDHHDKSFDQVPHLVWEKYKRNPVELKKREDALAKNAQYAFAYAADIIKGPFPEGEDAIAKDAQYAYLYAKCVKGPFPKGEDAIAKTATWSYHYAKDVLDGPFPKGEDAIAKDTQMAYFYAKDVLKGPFPKGADKILNGPWAEDYRRLIKKTK